MNPKGTEKKQAGCCLGCLGVIFILWLIGRFTSSSAPTTPAYQAPIQPSTPYTQSDYSPDNPTPATDYSEQDQTTLAQDSGYVYVTDTGSKYHRAGCQYLSQSAHQMTRGEAISAGYTACSVCNP